jgi:hypothetical protein
MRRSWTKGASAFSYMNQTYKDKCLSLYRHFDGSTVATQAKRLVIPTKEHICAGKIIPDEFFEQRKGGLLGWLFDAPEALGMRVEMHRASSGNAHPRVIIRTYKQVTETVTRSDSAKEIVSGSDRSNGYKEIRPASLVKWDAKKMDMSVHRAALLMGFDEMPSVKKVIDTYERLIAGHQFDENTYDALRQAAIRSLGSEQSPSDLESIAAIERQRKESIDKGPSQRREAQPLFGRRRRGR